MCVLCETREMREKMPDVSDAVLFTIGGEANLAAADAIREMAVNWMRGEGIHVTQDVITGVAAALTMLTLVGQNAVEHGAELFAEGVG